MPEYDAKAAKAELSAMMIKINHHLRRITIAKDRQTALEFADKLATMEKAAKEAVRRTR